MITLFDSDYAPTRGHRSAGAVIRTRMAYATLATAGVLLVAASSVDTPEPFPACPRAGCSAASSWPLGASAGPPQFPAPPVLPAPPAAPEQLAASVVRPEAQPANGFGIPATVLDAYRRAATLVDAQVPACGLPWPLLAAIGKVESNHAEDGDVTPAGDMIAPVYGPALDGQDGTAAIAGGGGWARALGPMQFIPSSWARWGSDGNGDGRADPQNVYDATYSAARYLCAAGGDLRTPGGVSSAILSYNHSAHYLQTVLAWLSVYQNGAVGVPDQPGGDPTVVADRSPASTPAEPVHLPAKTPPAPPAGPPGTQTGGTPPVVPPPLGVSIPAPPSSPPPPVTTPAPGPVTAVVGLVGSVVTRVLGPLLPSGGSAGS